MLPDRDAVSFAVLFLVLIAVAPWEPRVFQRIVKGAVVMTILVAGYCSLRYGIGSAAKETAADALRSTFVLACTSPLAISIGL